MKETKSRFPMVKGRFMDKEKFISEHPELTKFLEPLPEEIYFEYNKEEPKITYYFDAGLIGKVAVDSCDYLPLIVAQGIQDLEDELSVSRESIKLGPNQSVIHRDRC